MVVAGESLVPFDGVLQLELDFGIVGVELDGEFVHFVGGEGVVGPAEL